MHQIPTASGPTDIPKLARPGAGLTGEKVSKDFQDLMNSVTAATAEASRSGGLAIGSPEGGNAEAATAELFKRVSSLLDTAFEIGEAIEAGADSDQLSELKNEFSAALVQLTRDLQEVPLDARLTVAAAIPNDPDMKLDVAPLVQILENANPLEALRRLAAKSLTGLSERLTPEGKLSGLAAALSDQATTGGRFSMARDFASTGLGSFTALTVQRAPNGSLMSLIDVPSLEAATGPGLVQASSIMNPSNGRVQAPPDLEVDKIEEIADAGATALSTSRKQKKGAAPGIVGPTIDMSKAGATSQAVGLNAQFSHPVEGLEVRASNPLDAPARAQASADPSPSFMLARNAAAQIRGKVFEEGKTRVELSPRGLGDVEVEVARDDSGKLRVVLRVENPAVLTAFRQDREALLSVLREGGFEIDDSELAFEGFDGHGFRQSHERHRSSDPRRVSNSAALIDQNDDVPPPSRMPSAQSGLNIVA